MVCSSEEPLFPILQFGSCPREPCAELFHTAEPQLHPRMGCADSPRKRCSVDHSHTHRPTSLPAALGAGQLSSLLPSGPSSPALFPVSTLLSLKPPSLSVCVSALALFHLHLNLLSRLFHLRAAASPPLPGFLASCVVRLARESLHLCLSCPCYPGFSSFCSPHSPPCEKLRSP